jgi:hypothetical protein
VFCIVLSTLSLYPWDAFILKPNDVLINRHYPNLRTLAPTHTFAVYSLQMTPPTLRSSVLNTVCLKVYMSFFRWQCSCCRNFAWPSENDLVLVEDFFPLYMHRAVHPRSYQTTTRLTTSPYHNIRLPSAVHLFTSNDISRIPHDTNGLGDIYSP